MRARQAFKLNRFILAFIVIFLMIGTAFFIPRSTGTFKVASEVKGFNVVCKDYLDTAMLIELEALGVNFLSINMAIDFNIVDFKFRQETMEPYGDFADYKDFIKAAQSKGFKIMLKPIFKPYLSYISRKQILAYGRDTEAIQKHIDSTKTLAANRKITWIGGFELEKEEEWRLWQQEYEHFMLSLARFSQKMQVDLLSIGNEMDRVAAVREDLLLELINKVKAIYSGDLLYSANWSEYKKLSIWKHVDFIGVSGYFPLSKQEDPSVAELRNGWLQYKKSLEKVSRQYKKPVLFTEYGFRSITYSAEEPWNYNLYSFKGERSNNAQVNAFEATFEALQDEDWFHGGFIWKWTCDQNEYHNIDFSPQGKPAQEVIKSHYRQ